MDGVHGAGSDSRCRVRWSEYRLPVLPEFVPIYSKFARAGRRYGRLDGRRYGHANRVRSKVFRESDSVIKASVGAYTEFNRS